VVKLRLAFAVLVLPSIAWAQDGLQCDSATTQLEMNACAEEDLAKADKRLNEVYAALLKKEAKNTVFVKKLRAAQRAWIAFRDAELDAKFACAEPNPRMCWGSMYPLSFAIYKAQLTRERTKALEAYFTSSE
jgi:uncharacterized protein YecT (DUF1311 family)